MENEIGRLSVTEPSNTDSPVTTRRRRSSSVGGARHSMNKELQGIYSNSKGFCFLFSFLLSFHFSFDFFFISCFASLILLEIFLFAYVMLI